MFPDYEPAGRGYYRRTGIFSMMHTVVARRDLLAANPGRRRLYEVPVTVPWLNVLMEENGRLPGPDWWPYGISAGRTALGTDLRYHSEQGLSGAPLDRRRDLRPASAGYLSPAQSPGEPRVLPAGQPRQPHRRLGPGGRVDQVGGRSWAGC
jgi:hypothetical protein